MLAYRTDTTIYIPLLRQIGKLLGIINQVYLTNQRLYVYALSLPYLSFKNPIKSMSYSFSDVILLATAFAFSDCFSLT